ncbi:MAG TPA: glycosyl transferase family protein [Bryobacteraceae bacterium]
MASFVFSSLWPWLLGTLAVALLISGIDDFIPVLICLFHRLRHGKAGEREIGTPAERRIAIFVPCWKESEVIGNMVRHNLAAIRYRNFDFFLGVYPNDEATLAATTQLAEVFHNVHVAECANPGPTSKADCLNWVYRRMLRFEEDHGVYFDTIVLHDAEDMIHPEALALIDRERATYAMVQVPVLPLPTKLQEVTHGVYCDEFAEFQTIDMHARQFSGSFVPSNGVGTGFAREILERLAEERGEVFDAESLTEDYEIGVYIHAAGYRQLFAPLRRKDGEFIATREYFPRTARSAIRQRTRWITGIALQCWERRGWQGNWRTRYWFWRDRKGLIANPISLLTNVLFLAGITSWCVAAAQHQPWPLAVQDPALVFLCWLTLTMQCLRTGLRMVCVARIFGTSFALAVPLRAFHGNLINCSATLRALWRYVYNRWHGHTHAWLKTDHAYPAHEALAQHRGELTDVLVSCGFVSHQKLSLALAGLPSGENLAEYLRASGVVSDDDVCKALSLHTGIPSLKVDARKVKALVARSLPAHLEKRHGIVPVRVHGGKLLVAGRNVPSSDALEELQSFTSLPIEFQLVTQRNYEELQKLL